METNCLQEEFALCATLRGSSTGVVARVVVELVVEPVETRSRHRVAACPRSLGAGADE